MNNAKDSSTQGTDTTYCGLVAGQHVVCISADKDVHGIIILDKPILPVVGRVYTVRSLRVSELGKQVCLTLGEIPDQRVRFAMNGELYEGDVLFAAKHFRPLQKLTPEQFMQTDAPVEGREVMA